MYLIPSKASVLEQLKVVSKVFDDLTYYEMDVSGNDLEDAIFYSKLKDQVDGKIKEIKANDD